MTKGIFDRETLTERDLERLTIAMFRMADSVNVRIWPKPIGPVVSHSWTQKAD